MPFKSNAQRGYLYANNPAVAKEFEAATPKGVKLPDYAPKQPRVKDGNPRKRMHHFGK
jgi:hypothetical protein